MSAQPVRSAAPTARSHEAQSSAALAGVLDSTRPRRVVFVGCGNGDTIPLEHLLRVAEVVDFADADEFALARLREQVDALGSTNVEVRYHAVDLTGTHADVRVWANELAFAADSPADCMPALAARLLSLVPRFWQTTEAADLVVAQDLLTQLPTSVLKAIDAALRDRFGDAAYDPAARDTLNRATWTFTRTMEERFIGWLDTLVAPGGVVYLSDSVHVHSVANDNGSPGTVGGAWRMTATPQLRDYLRPWHSLIDQTAWDWWLAQPEADSWGRLYRMQAVAYRTPGVSAAVAAPRASGALPALLVPVAHANGKAAEGTTDEHDATAATPWLSRRVRILGRDFAAYLMFGALGYVAGIVLVFALAAVRGANLWVLALLLALAPPTIYAAAWLGNVRAGRLRLTFYRYAALYLLTAAIALRVLGRPVLPYIELLVIGTFACQIIGRFGCLMAGCCHGRPARFGVRYGADHARHGFPAHLAGVRILPVPVLESLICLLVAAAGVWSFIAGAPPGATLAQCLAMYAIGRFMLEELRGDTGRPHAFGLSEAQWTSLALLGVIAGVELLGWVPLMRWHVALTAAVAAAAAALITVRARGPRLLSPAQVRSVARALAQLRAQPDDARDPTPQIADAGELRISMQPVAAAPGDGWLVTVSQSRAWSRSAARRMTTLVRELTRAPRIERLAGRPELLHFLLAPTQPDAVVEGRPHGI
ncbi:MAG: prolipoprotein diacylglyceryl transferase family protein [Steroidobacteraceae bacterium]